MRLISKGREVPILLGTPYRYGSHTCKYSVIDTARA